MGTREGQGSQGYDRLANRANHAMSADGIGESSITHDPYIERHAEVVARHNGLIFH